MVVVSKESMPGIQGRILDDIETRLKNELPVPGFVIDSISRMHPRDICRVTGDEIALFDDVELHEFNEVAPEDAWRMVRYPVTVTPASYVNPVDIYYRTRIHPYTLVEVSLFDKLSHLVNQRYGLKIKAVTTGPIMSEELLSGQEDAVEAGQAALGLLYYHYCTVPNKTRFQGNIVDTTLRNDAKSHEASDFAPDVIVLIPVANGQERETLPHTLELLADQSLDYDQYEVVLLHNSRIDSDLYGTAEGNERTLKEIELEAMWLGDVYGKLLHEFPMLNIRAEIVAHAPYTTIGYCRMRLGDSAAARYIFRGSTNNPLLLNMDADIRSMNKDFLRNMLATADQTDKPVITSRLQWQPGANIELGPYTAKLMKLGTFLHNASRSFYNEPSFTDSGTAIRFKDYCLSGGHYWTQMFAETIQIVHNLHKIHSMQGRGGVIATSTGSRFGSNARRQIDMLARGHAPTRAWTRGLTTFGEDDDPVRLQESPHELAEKNAAANIEQMILETIDDTFGSRESEKYLAKIDSIRKALAILGLPDCLP